MITIQWLCHCYIYIFLVNLGFMLQKFGLLSTVKRLSFGEIIRENLLFSKRRVTSIFVTQRMMLSSIPNNTEKHSIVKRYENITKSGGDKREYRGLEFQNKIKVLLVHDPECDKAAAALDVNVGYLMDPREYPGIAHFCEHMLFLGTEKYPVENDYSKFISSHGGHCNAYTDTDHTNYHFEVGPSDLDGALDRFSQFFLSPLFTPSATEREVNAVDSEHRNNLKADSWRFVQIERSLSKPGGDYTRFGTGNKITLLDKSLENGISLRDELLKFHEKYYSSNLMTFCVVGKNTLDELEEMVLQKDFGKIVNKNVPSKTWNIKEFFGKSETGIKFEIVPVKDIQKISLKFPQDDFSSDYKHLPNDYISHLLGHEGKGSILQELRQRGWATGLSAGSRSISKGTEMFCVDITLTNEGVLKKEGPQEWIYDENEKISRTRFRFKDRESPMSYATNLSLKLQTVPMEDILTAKWLSESFNPLKIKQVLLGLTPENMIYSVIAQKFAGKPNAEKEIIYGTEYVKEKLSSEFIEELKKAENNPPNFLHLPEPNRYISTKFDLVERETPEIKHPRIIGEDKFKRIWFKQDNEFNLPKCNLVLSIHSPIGIASPTNVILSNIYMASFGIDIAADLYASGLAGYTTKHSVQNFGFFTQFKGYNEKIGIVAKDTIEKLINYTPSEKNFKVVHESTIRSLKNFYQNQPYALAMHYTSHLLNTSNWSKKQLLSVSEDVTFNDVIEFIPQFWKNYCLEFFYHGNITEKESLDICESISKTIAVKYPRSRPLFANEIVTTKEYKLFENKEAIYRHFQDTHDNNGMHIVFQCAQMLEEPCYNELRTQKQLGYIVHLGKRTANGSYGMHIIIQGDKDFDVMRDSVEEFLANFRTKLETMTEEEFDKYITAQIVKISEKAKTMYEKGLRYYEVICDGTYHFDRREDMISELRNITKEDIIKYWDETIAKNAPRRKKLTTIVYKKGATKDSIDTHSTDENIVEIKSAESFKSSSDLYGSPQPVIDIQPLGLPY
ncbi:Insulin-degrading enzyme [Strongyloides ratti]|uniref:Insulin-degrading enzyme n=1 Tax=Strongyloides ratti TaxID=34506 RepID=A0A090L892_STRRB|nr:Insulin-degrading enzyme [Strongyloides ratti]CEF64338.1 Insulin-degrading enzyme [Strongyloides ratti]